VQYTAAAPHGTVNSEAVLLFKELNIPGEVVFDRFTLPGTSDNNDHAIFVEDGSKEPCDAPVEIDIQISRLQIYMPFIPFLIIRDLADAFIEAWSDGFPYAGHWTVCTNEKSRFDLGHPAI